MKPNVVLLSNGHIEVDGIIYEHLSELPNDQLRQEVELVLANQLANQPTLKQPLYPVRRWAFGGVGSIGFFFIIIPFWLLPPKIAFAYMVISLSAGVVGITGGLLTRKIFSNRAFTFQLSVLIAFISFALGWFGMFALFNAMP